MEQQQEVLIEFVPERGGLLAEGHEQFTVMLSLRAPFYQETNRAPIDLVAVIDRSGSMSGTKIELVKETLKFVVKQLSSTDNLSIVIYDNEVDTLFSTLSMDSVGKEKANLEITTISARGSTDLCAGLLRGIDIVTKKKNEVASVLLFTDGLVNAGIQSVDEIVAEVTKKQVDGKLPCTIHTFGFGSDHALNILKSLSEKGNGSYFFIENKDTIPNAFADCLGGLLSVVAQNLKIEIEGQQGTVNKVQTTFDSTSTNGKTTISIGDIQSEEEKDILCVLKVPNLENNQQINLVTAKISYFNVLTSKQEDKVIMCELKQHDDYNSLPVNEKIDVQKNRILTTEALASGKAFGDAGNYVQGREVVNNAIKVLKSSASANNKYVLSLIRDLEDSLAGLQDRDVYSTYGGYQMASYTSAHRQQRATHTTSAYTTTSRYQMSEKWNNNY